MAQKINPKNQIGEGIAFRAKITQSIPSSAGYTDVNGYAVHFNYGTAFSSGNFTAPVSGVYNLSVTVGFENLTANARMGVQILVATDSIAGDYSYSFANTYDTMASASVTTYMTAGQTAYIRIYQDGGTSRVPDGYSNFSGHLVMAV